MSVRIGLAAALVLLAGYALARDVDPKRAQDAAAVIISNNAVEEYCADDSPTVPGFTDEETDAACDIVANSEDD